MERGRLARPQPPAAELPPPVYSPGSTHAVPDLRRTTVNVPVAESSSGRDLQFAHLPTGAVSRRSTRPVAVGGLVEAD